MKYFKSLLAYGIPFGVGMGVYFGYQYGLWYGAIGGISAGLLFGASMAAVNNVHSKRIAKVKNAASAENSESKIIFSSLANIKYGFVPRLGWLSLTPTHLIFTKESKKKSNNEKIEIALADINDVTVAKYRLNRNAILVTYSDGKSQIFIIDSLDPKHIVKNTVWIEEIQKAISALKEDL